MRALSTWIDGFIGSAKSTGKKILNAFGKEIPEMQEYFASDFGGHGWKIYKELSGKYILEIDNIRVRESLIAHELVIDKIRAIAGSLGISQACGKVKEVNRVYNTYYLTLEGDETHGYGGFQVNDFIRCQRLTSNGVKGYWVKISSVSDDGSTISFPFNEIDSGTIIVENSNGSSDYVSEGSGTMDFPANGDEIVQYGNSTDTTRQSAIYIHANGQGQPAIDILEGIKTKSFANCLTCRLGGNLPDGGGFGLYSKNGKIISKTDDVTNYELNPDGTFNLGKGAIQYNGKQVTIDNSVKINWGASSQANITYATNDNATTPPTSGWSADITKVNPKKGQYLWTKTMYPDNSYSYSVSYLAKDGEDGLPGKDGASMQPNLLDYTSFPQEIFDEKPSGLTLNGERVNGVDGYGAIEAEIDMGDENSKDIWMFQENVLSRVEKSTWYTLSFYTKGNDGKNLYTYIRSTDDKVLIDTSEKILIDGKEQKANTGLAWVMSNTWVRHTLTFKTASVLSEKNFLILFRIFGSDTVPSYSADICQIKLERGKGASAWCMSETDKIAAVKIPSWLNEWSGETTSVGAEYVAAKNAFFGKKADDKYTGIMMSSDGLRVGDSNVVGLYALLENKIVVAIDPINKRYLFRGDIYAEQGQICGVSLGLSLNGVTVVTSSNFASLFTCELVGGNKYYAAPEFSVVNPVIVINSILDKMTIGGGNTGIIEANVAISGFVLPYYISGSDTDSDSYKLALGFLGKSLHITNNLKLGIEIRGYFEQAGSFYKKMVGTGIAHSFVSKYTLKGESSISLTMHMDDNGSLFWVYEEAATFSSSSGGTVPSITDTPIINPNKKGWIDSVTGGNTGGNNSEIIS